MGWGLFDLVEGLVDHQLLGAHHVGDDLVGSGYTSAGNACAAV